VSALSLPARVRGLALLRPFADRDFRIFWFGENVSWPPAASPGATNVRVPRLAETVPNR